MSPLPGNPTADRRTSARRPAAWRLLALLATATLGLTAQVTADDARWLGYRGPRCPLGICFGPNACPGCGLVRGTAAALQGDLGFAWQMHPAGLFVAILITAGIVLHADILRRGTATAAHLHLRRLGQRLFVAAVLLGWCVRLLLR